MIKPQEKRRSPYVYQPTKDNCGHPPKIIHQMKTTTVYLPVSVEERLPEEEGSYTLISTDGVLEWESKGDWSFHDNAFTDENNWIVRPKYWLEKQERIVMTPEQLSAEMEQAYLAGWDARNIGNGDAYHNMELYLNRDNNESLQS